MKETQNIFTLPDGRKLCYALYGNPEGKPVFLFHGNPGSRLSWGLIPGSPFRDDLFIIAPDRPGYGQTSFTKNAIERWPQDIAHLADHLKIKKFILFAPSGGGPYALACAWKIPERISAFGLFGTVGPYTEESVVGTLKSVRLLWRISKPLHLLVKLQMRIMAILARKNPRKLAFALRDLELNELDQKIFERPEIQNIFIQDFPEAYRQNGIGSAYDTLMPKSWPVPLDEVKIKTHVWHCMNDNLVGDMSKVVAAQLPKSVLHVVEGSGHLWILDHMSEVLGVLLKGV